jgi:hypothetical protein
MRALRTGSDQDQLGLEGPESRDHSLVEGKLVGLVGRTSGDGHVETAPIKLCGAEQDASHLKPLPSPSPISVVKPESGGLQQAQQVGEET